MLLALVVVFLAFAGILSALVASGAIQLDTRSSRVRFDAEALNSSTARLFGSIQTVQYKVSDWYATIADYDTEDIINVDVTSRPFFLVNRQASALKKHRPFLCLEAQQLPSLSVSADEIRSNIPETLAIDGEQFLLQPCTFSEQTTAAQKIKRQTFYYNSDTQHILSAANRGYCMGINEGGDSLQLVKCNTNQALSVIVYNRTSKIQGFADPYKQVYLTTPTGNCVFIDNAAPTLSNNPIPLKVTKKPCTSTNSVAANSPPGMWWSLVTT